jgi:hypothetical protein
LVLYVSGLVHIVRNVRFVPSLPERTTSYSIVSRGCFPIGGVAVWDRYRLRRTATSRPSNLLNETPAKHRLDPAEFSGLADDDLSL